MTHSERKEEIMSMALIQRPLFQPAIAGSNGNEDASLITWPGVDGPNMTEIREKVRTGRTCPVTYLSKCVHVHQTNLPLPRASQIPQPSWLES